MAGRPAPFRALGRLAPVPEGGARPMLQPPSGRAPPPSAGKSNARPTRGHRAAFLLAEQATDPQVALRVRVDALVMASAWVATRSPPLPPCLPPCHDVATLCRAKLPVSAAVNRPIRSATGVHCSARRLRLFIATALWRTTPCPHRERQNLVGWMWSPTTPTASASTARAIQAQPQSRSRRAKCAPATSRPGAGPGRRRPGRPPHRRAARGWRVGRGLLDRPDGGCIHQASPTTRRRADATGAELPAGLLTPPGRQGL